MELLLTSALNVERCRKSAQTWKTTLKPRIFKDGIWNATFALNNLSLVEDCPFIRTTHKHGNKSQCAIVSQPSFWADIEALVQSIMTKTIDVDNSSIWQCVQCGKTSKFSTNLKDHIEAHHLENLQIGCSICSKIFKSRGSLRFHMRSHKVWQVCTFCPQYNIHWLQRY